jgi:hypothetical protein
MPAEPDRGIRATLLACLAPALVLVAIVVPYLRFHEYSMLLPESVILIAGAAALGALFGLLGRLRPATLGPALIALVLCIYAFYRPELTDRFIQTADAIADRTGNIGVVLGLMTVGIFLALGALCVALRRHLTTIVTVVFGTIILSTVVLPTPHGGEAVEAGALPAELADLPPVVHVILDEHIGLGGLPTGYPESAEADAAIRAAYADFALFGGAYSRFAETKYSLASMMNGDRGTDVAEIIDGDLFQFAMTESDWFERLRAEGYAIRVYQNAWFDMCGAAPGVDACYTYPLFSPNAVQRTPLSTDARLRVLFQKLVFGKPALQLGPLASTEALARFEDDLHAAPRGVAYIVHLLLPHFGYLYDADCTLADPSQWQRDEWGEDGLYSRAEYDAMYRLYLAQTVCAARRMEALFAEMKALGVWDEATIIVHGDHGSRIGERPYIIAAPELLSDRNLVDHFSTLLAVKAPGLAPGIRPEPVTLQGTFADLFLGGRRVGEDENGEVLVRTSDEDEFRPVAFGWHGENVAPVAEANVAAQPAANAAH